MWTPQFHSHSPMSLADPQFIKATIVHQDQAYDDKIYYFFREDNPDKNPEAPLNVSRVAQLCRVSGLGGVAEQASVCLYIHNRSECLGAHGGSVPGFEGVKVCAQVCE